ncbi:MAG: hypothetical protein F9K40_19800 [Kofleriaceae bacterium]|nr:MAG: hypothetical protein F9K40_19800 [Kofleriaceae bacterium]MBZ0238337.1 hypothetical protein [Kofleriaceae bacterium]
MTHGRFALIFATMYGVGLAGCTMCRDERPPVDDEVAMYGKNLGEAREEAEEKPSAADELRTARRRFVASSQVQLAVMATEVERRGMMDNVPIERVENLRKDYWHLVELRRLVLDAPDETFKEALDQYQVHVDTIREQLARIDRGQLP